jgi:hypothetical protein
MATPQPEQASTRLIRSAPLRSADVAVAQNDLPPSCATGPSPVAHPTSRSMTSPAPSVTVMTRPAADAQDHHPRRVREGRPLGQAVTSYVADGPASQERGEELAVAAPARPSGRDGVMASPPPLPRRWLLEGAGAAFQNVLTASTVTCLLGVTCESSRLRSPRERESDTRGGTA